MRKTSLPLVLICLGVLHSLTVSCTKEAISKPNYVFKAAPDMSQALKIGDEVITKDALFKGIEAELYEEERRLFDLKMNKANVMILERIMAKDPNKGGLTNDEYLEKYVIKDIKIKPEDVKKFIAEKGIPKEHHTPDLNKRVEDYLMIEKKKQAVEEWRNAKSKDLKIEIYLERPKRPTFDVAAGDAPFAGDKEAKVTVVEFSDFQCPFCSRGAEIMDQVKAKYGNKVKVAFKNFPLPFHAQAKDAAAAGLCAFEQGSKEFWKLHDAMFKNQGDLSKAGLTTLAEKAGLNKQKFEECVSSGRMVAKVEQDLEYGKKVGVKSTPTFFVNGKLVNGAQEIDVFSEVIDDELAR